VDVIVQTPPVATALPNTVAPSSNWTVNPAWAVPVNVGVVSLVRSSEFDAPLSLAAVRSGVERAGGVVSMVTASAVELALVLPAASIVRAAILCSPSVSALDVSVQAQVLNLLKDLQDRHGLTYIFISHDLSVVKFMADMMAVMNQGKIVEFGPSENIYANPKEEYTRRLMAASIRRSRYERAAKTCA
jgi:ABC-type cobalamin transport system ATPase subunit